MRNGQAIAADRIRRVIGAWMVFPSCWSSVAARSWTRAGRPFCSVCIPTFRTASWNRFPSPSRTTSPDHLGVDGRAVRVRAATTLSEHVDEVGRDRTGYPALPGTHLLCHVTVELHGGKPAAHRAPRTCVWQGRSLVGHTRGCWLAQPACGYASASFAAGGICVR